MLRLVLQMSAPDPAARFAALLETPADAESLTPGELYKIIEAAVRSKLGHADRTILASTLHAFVREVTFNSAHRPNFVDSSEWFAPREHLADVNLGLEAYVKFFNPSPPASPAPSSTRSYSPTYSQLHPDSDVDSDQLERLGFDPEDYPELFHRT